MFAPSDISIRKDKTYVGHSAAVFKLINGYTSNTFLSAGGDGVVAEWQIRGDEMTAKAVAVVSSSIFSLLKLNDSQLLIIGQLNGDIQVMDLRQRNKFINLKQSAHAIYDLVLLKDRIYAASGNGNIFVFNANDFSFIRSIKISTKSIRCLIAVADTLFAGASDSRLYIISDDSSFQCLDSLHQNSIFSLLYLKERNLILSGSRDAHMGIRSFQTVEYAAKLIPAHLNTINHIVLNANCDIIATASRDKTIKLWDAETFRLLKVIDARYDGHKNSVNNVFWTADDKYLISCGDDRQVIQWEIKISKSE